MTRITTNGYTAELLLYIVRLWVQSFANNPKLPSQIRSQPGLATRSTLMTILDTRYIAAAPWTP